MMVFDDQRPISIVNLEVTGDTTVEECFSSDMAEITRASTKNMLLSARTGDVLTITLPEGSGNLTFFEYNTALWNKAFTAAETITVPIPSGIGYIRIRVALS